MKDQIIVNQFIASKTISNNSNIKVYWKKLVYDFIGFNYLIKLFSKDHVMTTSH